MCIDVVSKNDDFIYDLTFPNKTSSGANAMTAPAAREHQTAGSFKDPNEREQSMAG